MENKDRKNNRFNGNRNMFKKDDVKKRVPDNKW